MHLGKALAFVSLGPVALGYVIDAFKDEDCKGDKLRVNVWDNTCRSENTIPTRSFRVIKYGAHRQKATLWKYDFCSNSPPPEEEPSNTEWWADGGDNAFKKDKCLNLGYEANAYGSHSG
ncbi:hypothetical protein AJ79_03235 [Helicocarpus griseus UAMH5409]|uniref:Uncharacterized protein n=1 Tax=Helicocarpus griseus UAMH5409 TaxID=1447875 RepID=A0A2B7XZY1_9EURO|nr:hypothetical protein AJ79_03235 [Helicocarpus griseus UAMH5409]